MPFTKVAETTFTVAAGAGSENKTLPGTPQAGDLVIVALACDNNIGDDGVNTSGYSTIEPTTGTTPGRQLAYKVMSGTPDTLVNILQDSTAIIAGLIQIWRGQHGTVLDSVTPILASGSSANPRSSKIVPNTLGALVFSVAFLDDDDSAVGVVAPSGYSNLLAADTGQASTTVGATVAIASKEHLVGGPEEPGPYTFPTSDVWNAISFVVKPLVALSSSNYHLRREVFVDDGNWVVPAGVTEALVESWGAGGGGLTNTCAGGGGAYMKKVISSLVAGDVYSVDIGQGAADTDGEDTTFSDDTPTVLLRAKGGKSGTNGGAGGLASAGVGDSGYDGGAGGSGAGDQDGGGGAGDSASASLIEGGVELGGKGADASAALLTGFRPGGGGSSRAASQGAGAPGILIVTYLAPIADNLPFVLSRAWTRDLAADTSHPVSMPSGIQSGDLLIVLYGCDGDDDGAGDHEASGWTRLDIDSNGGQVVGAVFYKIAAGGDTCTISSIDSEVGASVALRVRNYNGAPISVSANGSSTTPDSPNNNPGVSDRWLWLAFTVVDAVGGSFSKFSPSIYQEPYGYSEFFKIFGISTGAGVGIILAEKHSEASSEDPPPFEVMGGTDNWASFTIGIKTAIPPLTAEHGEFLLTGQDADLITEVAYSLLAGQGDFTLTGQNADLYETGVMPANKGDFELAGQAAGLYHNRFIDAAHGEFALIGIPAILNEMGLLEPEAGEFVVSGQGVILTHEVVPSIRQFQVLINDVDVTDKVIGETLEKTDLINERTDTCRFRMRKIKGITPESNDEVKVRIFDGLEWVLIFAGNITRINMSPIQRLDIEYEIECEDYGHILGAKLVNNRYEDMTAGDIVRSIINLYCPGFTFSNVEDGITIATIAFERVPVNEAIQRVAELTNYSWYVDYERDVHFFAKNSEAAPFNLTGSSHNFFWDSLRVSKDITQIRNRVIVRGGLERADTERTEEFITPDDDANGRALFRLAYKYDNISAVTVEGVAQTVGIDGVDDENNFDCMWNADQKYIRFPSGNEPNANDEVAVTGTPLFPIIVSVQDNPSIAEFANAFFDGVFEHFIKDPDIKSQDEALQRADSELDAYAAELNDGEFRTKKYGLRSGQLINITAQDTSADFLIQRVRFSIVGSANNSRSYEWHIYLASLKTIGIIEVLQQLLRKKTISSGEQEILLSLLQINDEFYAVDDDPTVSSTTTEDYVWEQADPGSDSEPNPIKWNLFTWAGPP